MEILWSLFLTSLGSKQYCIAGVINKLTPLMKKKQNFETGGQWFLSHSYLHDTLSIQKVCKSLRIAIDCKFTWSLFTVSSVVSFLELDLDDLI